MVKEFQPYLDLWTTASDWLRWSESWMNDPLSAIDAEQLEKNVIESFKTMHKCVKQFKDIHLLEVSCCKTILFLCWCPVSLIFYVSYSVALIYAHFSEQLPLPNFID